MFQFPCVFLRKFVKAKKLSLFPVLPSFVVAAILLLPGFLLAVLLVLERGAQPSSRQPGLEGLVHLFALFGCEVVLPVAHLTCTDRKQGLAEFLL